MAASGGSPDEGAHDGTTSPPAVGEQSPEQPGSSMSGAPWAAPETSSPAADYPPAYPPPGYPPGPLGPAGYPSDYAPAYPPPISPTNYAPPGYSPYGAPPADYPGPYPAPMASPYGGAAYPPPSYPGGNFPPPDYTGGYYSPPGPAVPGTNTMAIVSLVSSFVGVFCCIGSIVSIVMGTIALNQIKQTREDGYGLAVAGIVISVATLLVYLIVAIFSIPSH
ncbi:hypothetical protein I546_2141 [Mycobacterium kansasii 732]|uniref:DUF4190 domain-containing protein n=1 Tax=Mycobacterium pseudokansasii TaxID=2341080 RepID=UPI000452A01F|nr:DUF4190 domain-containing protein [Mycobacterium pseudokansasii]EUA12819.1 hypothetical protein I546_2141 [Mycobacterium kansasii 732]MBY0386878.1 DUF4190 domain-containing protein [Mycobacterium pseudokansasii]